MTLPSLSGRLLALALCTLPGATLAEGLSYGEGFTVGERTSSVGSFTNDALGDAHDRWQTASYQRSWFFDQGTRMSDDTLEFRFRGQIVSPWHPSLQPGDDRPYATSLGLGAFTHKEIGGFDARMGAELLMIGDQTRLDWVQYTAHDLVGYDGGYDPRTRNDPHVADSLGGRIEIELAKDLQLGPSALVRPYVMAEAGSENAVRAGADFIFGGLAWQGDKKWTRDVVTGQALPSSRRGSSFSFIAGADFGHVDSSYLIPDDSAVDLEQERVRARLGVQGSVGNLSIFFGQTWMSEEFVGQEEKQRLGTLSVSFAF